MTNREQATMTRNSSCCAYLDKNIAIFENDLAFTNVYFQMKDASAAAVDSSIETDADNTGYSEEKVTAKNNACETASELCASAQIKLAELDNLILYNMLHSAKRYYFGVADALTLSRLQFAHDIMNSNKLQITIDYITEEELEGLQTKINKYSVLIGTTSNANSGATVITSNYKENLKETSTVVLRIKQLVKKYKTSEPTFYKGVLKSCKTPPVNVHHTQAFFKIFDLATGALLEGVTGTLSNSTQILISNILGLILFDSVLRGKSIATFEIEGYITQSMEITILVGEKNEFVVAMEAILNDEL